MLVALDNRCLPEDSANYEGSKKEYGDSKCKEQAIIFGDKSLQLRIQVAHEGQGYPVALFLRAVIVGEVLEVDSGH